MAKWRDCYPSNRDGTCLWCGEPLGDSVVLDWPISSPEPIGSTRTPRGGYGGEGMFCSLRCGFQFGAAMARRGRRFSRASGRRGEIEVEP